MAHAEIPVRLTLELKDHSSVTVLHPGDTLVIGFSNALSIDELDRLRAYVRTTPLHDKNIGVVVFDNVTTMGKVTERTDPTQPSRPAVIQDVQTGGLGGEKPQTLQEVAEYEREIEKIIPGWSKMSPDEKQRHLQGHGHVYPRPDGIRARCGGPGICPECARDLAQKEQDRDKSLGGQGSQHTYMQHEGTGTGGQGSSHHTQHHTSYYEIGRHYR